jgi:hypothetical protein
MCSVFSLTLCREYHEYRALLFWYIMCISPHLSKRLVYTVKGSVKQNAALYRRLELCSDDRVWITKSEKRRKKKREKKTPGVVVTVMTKRTYSLARKSFRRMVYYPKEKEKQYRRKEKKKRLKGNIEKTPHAFTMLMCCFKIANGKDKNKSR